MAAVAEPRHPNKEVRAALDYALGKGWTLRMQGQWGRLYCPHQDRDGCQVGVSGTPRNPDDHRRQIVRAVDRCPHQDAEAGDAEI